MEQTTDISNYILNFNKMKQLGVLNLKYDLYNTQENTFILELIQHFRKSQIDDNKMYTPYFNHLYYNGLLINIRKKKIDDVLKD